MNERAPITTSKGKFPGMFRNCAEYLRHNWRKTAEVTFGAAATAALGLVAAISATEYGTAFFIAPLPLKTLAAGFILIPAAGALIAGVYTVSRIRN